MFFIENIHSGKLKLSDFKLVECTPANLNKARKNSTMSSIKDIWHTDKLHNSAIWEDDSGNPIACVSVYHSPNKNDRYIGRYWINNLEVSKKYRNKDLGRQVLDYAVKHMHGDAIIVNADNDIAFKLYKNYGFKVGSDTEVKRNGKIEYYQMYYGKFPDGITPFRR